MLVVEKESVFRRLIDDGLTSKLPCLLITACGFPDMATRAMRCIGVALCDAPSRARCGDAKTDARDARGEWRVPRARAQKGGLGFETGCSSYITWNKGMRVLALGALRHTRCIASSYPRDP